MELLSVVKLDFTDFIKAAERGDLEEHPVGIEEFVYGEDYLNMGSITLSDQQIEAVQASTQIYRLETLMEYISEDRALKRFAQTNIEVILQWGKGAGKDLISAISCCYLVYLLLCLKDPAQYFGKPPEDDIHLLNVAVNSDQAKIVFFANVKRIVRKAPWFQGRYEAGLNGEPIKDGRIEFNKNITLFSGHSEREAWEGLNLIAVFLDEISGFSANKDSSKSAEDLYDMYRASVDSRFPGVGKVVMLSFPRHKNDFIQQRYTKAVGMKEVVNRTHTFQKDPALPRGIPDNEFTIAWEEDHITHYTYPGVYAIKRPSWDVNPTKRIEDYGRAFYENPLDAKGRFACEPADAVDAYIKDGLKVESALTGRNGVDNDSGRFYDWFIPDDDKKYYVHVDLAFKHDRCAVAMAHVEKFVSRSMGDLTQISPFVIVDAVRYWTPTKAKDIDFGEVLDYILSLIGRDFNVRLITYDQWYSKLIQESLDQKGIRNERLSVQKPQFNDMMYAIMEERIQIPDDEELKRELLSLRITSTNKIDHPRTGAGSDLAVATAGAVHNAIARTPRSDTTVIEVATYKHRPREKRELERRPGPVIEAPKRVMPDNLRRMLGGIV